MISFLNFRFIAQQQQTLSVGVLTYLENMPGMEESLKYLDVILDIIGQRISDAEGEKEHIFKLSYQCTFYNKVKQTENISSLNLICCLYFEKKADKHYPVGTITKLKCRNIYWCILESLLKWWIITLLLNSKDHIRLRWVWQVYKVRTTQSFIKTNGWIFLCLDIKN